MQSPELASLDTTIVPLKDPALLERWIAAAAGIQRAWAAPQISLQQSLTRFLPRLSLSPRLFPAPAQFEAAFTSGAGRVLQFNKFLELSSTLKCLKALHLPYCACINLTEMIQT